MMQTREERKAYNAAYYAAHRKEIAVRGRVYRGMHKAEIAEREAEYYASHRSERRARDRAYYAAHRKEIAVRGRVYRGMHKAEIAARMAAYRAARRAAQNRLVFDHYGNKCACCSERTPEFLCIDHIDGCGRRLRGEQGRGWGFYEWLIKHDFPAGYQTLCHNCNQAKSSYGQCPHKGQPMRMHGSTRGASYQVTYRAKARVAVFDHYGGICKCCGETTPEFLSIDHINGGGTKHRKEVGSYLYAWLRREGYPQGFQVLCFNCNDAKGANGICPHERARREAAEH